MNKEQVKKALSELKENSKKRNFKQSIDLIFTFRDLNLKNPEEQLDFSITLNHGIGKKVRVAALTGPEMADNAKKVCDLVITQADFDKYKDKKEAKKLASNYDYFIGQADIMPKIAGAFGRFLGPRNKMPNPKLGTILPGKAPVEPVYGKLQKTVRVVAKKSPMAQVKIGSEAMNEDEVIDNILTVYNQVIHHLPKEKSNLKGAYLKLTMSKPVKLE
jgi:large subunit ribosomal protein L1